MLTWCLYCPDGDGFFWRIDSTIQKAKYWWAWLSPCRLASLFSDPQSTPTNAYLHPRTVQLLCWCCYQEMFSSSTKLLIPGTSQQLTTRNNQVYAVFCKASKQPKALGKLIHTSIFLFSYYHQIPWGDFVVKNGNNVGVASRILDEKPIPVKTDNALDSLAAEDTQRP